MSANIPNRPPIASPGGILLILAVFGLIALAAPGPAAAQTARPTFVGGESRTLFEARGVAVDVTAATVTEARERALTQGRVAGLRQVVEHLAPREELAKLPQLSTEQIIEMVQEFSLANERTSAVRYIAEMNVRYNPDAVRRVLRAAKIAFTEIPSRPMVLVPLYMEGKQAAALDENPWREAWARLKVRSPLVPLILAGPDAPVKAEQLEAKDVAAMQAIAAHYDAAGVIVARLTAGDAMPIVLTQIRGAGAPSDIDISASAQPGQSREESLLGAAATAADAVAQAWIKRNLVDLSVTTQLTALAQIKELKDWLRIRERLKEVPLVSRVDLQAITRDRAQVTLRYAGDQPRLQAALAEQNLALTQQGGVWILAPRRAEGAQ